MKNIFLYLLLVFFVQNSCTEDEPADILDQLPPITMTGENTFGCLLNGEVWLPEGPLNPLDFNPDAKYNEATKTLQLKAKKLDDNANIQDIMHIRISTSQAGEYEFSYILDWTYSGQNQDCRNYYLDTSRYNFVTISNLDKENDIISGTFDFKVINAECMDTLHFSDGRFDINYHL